MKSLNQPITEIEIYVRPKKKKKKPIEIVAFPGFHHQPAVKACGAVLFVIDSPKVPIDLTSFEHFCPYRS